MNSPVRTPQDAWDNFEEEAIPRYEGGRCCPPYTLDLLELARAVHQGDELTEDEQMLKRHIDVDQCAACRAIYDSSLWFLQQECAEAEGQCTQRGVADELMASQESLIERLCKAQSQMGFKPLTLAAYVEELRFSAGISEGGVIRALDLPRDRGIQSLNDRTSKTVEAAMQLQLDQRFVRCALKFACVATVVPEILAAREMSPASQADCSAVCDELRRRMESVATCDDVRSQIEACDRELNDLFSDTEFHETM